MFAEFEELTSRLRCTNNNKYNITKMLQMLVGAEIIKFSRTDIGFRIEI